MPQEVIVKKKNGIIEIKSKGQVTFQDVTETLSTVKQINEETGFITVLDDAREETSTLETFEMFEFFSAMFPRFLQFAMLVDEETRTRQIRQFGETVAKNRGHCVKLFISKTEAINWLTKRLTT